VSTRTFVTSVLNNETRSTTEIHSW